MLERVLPGRMLFEWRGRDSSSGTSGGMQESRRHLGSCFIIHFLHILLHLSLQDSSRKTQPNSETSVSSERLPGWWVSLNLLPLDQSALHSLVPVVRGSSKETDTSLWRPHFFESKQGVYEALAQGRRE